MKRCPITYLPVTEGDYSTEGVRLLSTTNSTLSSFPYSQAQQLELALKYADKLSIQGVQPKLSVIFDETLATFKPVQKQGTYILKLPHRIFQEVPPNEDLTMRLAQTIGLSVPLHGMIYASDGTLLYFIQRFDREAVGHHFGTLCKKPHKTTSLHKISVEDFTQLTGLSRDTKYDFTMEKIVPILEQYCTFPKEEKQKLFKLVLFSFLVGNEDLHLKNFSLIRRAERVELSPVYDLVNTTLILNSKEEMALPLRGKKSKFTRADWIDYYGQERLGLSREAVHNILAEIGQHVATWEHWIRNSFLSEASQKAYLQIVQKRCQRIF